MEPARALPAVLLAASLAACTSATTREHLRSAESSVDAIVRIPAATPSAEAGPVPVEAPAVDEAIYKRPLLPDLEAAALARHPSLVASAHRVRELAARARAEGKLPPPEIAADVWQVPFARPYALDRASMIMFSLRQAIPPAGSLDRMAEATALEARAEASRLAGEARVLVREVDRAFADYVEAEARHAVHMEHTAALEQLAEAARARYAAGGALSDVAKADLERARMDAEMERERGMVMVARARLNGLLSRSADAAIGPPDAGDAVTADLTPAQATELSRKSPEVAAAELREKSALAAAEGASREALVPAFNVGLSAFLPVNNTPAGYGASFSMSLPWLWGPGADRARSAEQRALAERAVAQGARRRVESDAASALAAVRAAERRHVVLTRRALPAARRALDSSRAGYATKGTDILAWLDAARASLDVAMEVVAARGDLDRALADLDWAVGGKAPRVPVSASKEELHDGHAGPSAPP